MHIEQATGPRDHAHPEPQRQTTHTHTGHPLGAARGESHARTHGRTGTTLSTAAANYTHTHTHTHTGRATLSTRQFPVAIYMYAGTSRVQTRCHEYSTRPLRPSRPRPRRRLNSRPVSPLACNGYSYSPFIAKPKAARGLCFRQLGGHFELPRLMRKYDVIRKTGSTYRIATAPQQDRAAAMGYMHKNSAKIGRVVLYTCLYFWKHGSSAAHQRITQPTS